MSQKHKTLRSFYCEDVLWENFEAMTRDLDCSMDYLINEAMRQHARGREQGASGTNRLRQQVAPPPPVPPASRTYPPPQPPPVGQYGAVPRPLERQPPAPPPVQPPQPPIHSDARTIPFTPPTYERPSGFNQAHQPTTPRMPPVPKVPPPASPQDYAAPRPAQPVPSYPQQEQWRPQIAHPAQQAKPHLYLYFNGQRYVVNKDRFVVGRGSQGTDLTIRDGNISRKHAAVIFHEGSYYFQDLGSTNGIEFNGSKIESKQINEGDLYNICDYELRFSYQG